MAHSATGIIPHALWSAPALRMDGLKNTNGKALAFSFGSLAPSPYFEMIGVDNACDPPALITWLVRGTPDLSGAQIPSTAYSCGSTPADVSGIRVLATYGVPEIVSVEAPEAEIGEGDGYLVVTDETEMVVTL